MFYFMDRAGAYALVLVSGLMMQKVQRWTQRSDKVPQDSEIIVNFRIHED